MKPLSLPRSTALAVAVLLAFLSGCDATGPKGPEVGFDAAWAGEPWPGEASARLTTDGVLYVFGRAPARRPETPSSAVTVGVAFDGPGTYPLAAGAARFEYLVGGDVLASRYETTDEHTGTLIVHEITSTRVRGRVTFDAVSGGEYRPVGPQARFEGTFEAGLTRAE